MTGNDDRLDEPDRVQCALSDLLSSVAEAVREHAVGGTPCLVGLRSNVEKLGDLLGAPSDLAAQLRDARAGKPFALCEACEANLEAPMCDDCYRRSGPLAAANSARDAAIAQLGDANREIDALVKQVNGLCDVRDAALKARAELRGARAENERLRRLADAAQLLGPARRLLDEVAERHDVDDLDDLGCRCGDLAQRIVDLIGHPVTDEPPHILAELAAERAKVQRLQAAIDAANVQLNLAFQYGWPGVHVDNARAALTGGEEQKNDG